MDVDSLGELTESQRVDLLYSLIETVPRYHLVAFNRVLADYVKRDILAALPDETAFLIFSFLPVEDLLNCALVSKKWHEIANDQGLWRTRCRSEGIRPNLDVTWKNIFSASRKQQSLQEGGGGAGPGPSSIAARHLRRASLGRNSLPDFDEIALEDENGDGEDDDDLEASGDEDVDQLEERRIAWRLGRAFSRSSFSAQPGMRSEGTERGTSPMDDTGQSPGRLRSLLSSSLPSTSFMDRPRRPTFNTGRNHSGLPVFSLGGPASMASYVRDHSSGRARNEASPTAVHNRASSESGIPTNFASYRSEPSPFPKPNYKHLYLMHRILRKRFLRGQPEPVVLDGKVSARNGGLDGHTEGIYCLQILNQYLSIEVDNPSPEPTSPTRTMASGARRHRSMDFNSESTNPQPRMSSNETDQSRAREGRHWILSGSRDRSIRLWDLDLARVVKVYSVEETGKDGRPSRGHHSSVLTLHARMVRRRDFGANSASGQRRTNQRADQQLLMIAGGSDGKLVLWDVVTGRIEGEIQAHDRGDSVLCVRFDEDKIVSCSKDRSIRVFSLDTFERLVVIGGPSSTVGMSAENHLLATDIPTPGDLPSDGHKAAVNAIDLVGDKIVSVSGDRCVCVWSVETGDLLFTIDDHSRGIASLAVDHETGDIVTGCSDWAIRKFRLGHLLLSDAQRSDSERISGPWLSSLLSSQSRSKSSSRGQNASVPALIFRADSDCLNCRAMEYGRRIRETGDAGPGFNDVGWTLPAGTVAASIAVPGITGSTGEGYRGTPPLEGGYIHFPAPQPTLDNPFTHANPMSNFSANVHRDHGGRQALATEEGLPGILCPSCERRGHKNLVRSLWMGKDVVLSGSYDTKVKLWNRETGGLIADLPSLHSGRLFSVVGDSTKVVSGGIEPRIIVWDFSTGLDTSFVI